LRPLRTCGASGAGVAHCRCHRRLSVCPQVVSRRFSSFHGVKPSVPTAHRAFCAEFDSRPLHEIGRRDRPCLLPSAGFTPRGRSKRLATGSGCGCRVGLDADASRCSYQFGMPERPDYAATCGYGYIESSAVKTSPWTRDGVSLCVALPQAHLSARIQPAAPGFLARRITPPPSWDVMQRCHRRSN
jgi:hypothetical protein